MYLGTILVNANLGIIRPLCRFMDNSLHDTNCGFLNPSFLPGISNVQNQIGELAKFII